MSADGPVDAGAADAIFSPGSFDGPAGDCRWQGYGVGALGAGQCDSMHLLEHSTLECQADHGTLGGFRAIVDQCVNGGDEVQVLCCFVDGVPAGLPDPLSLVPGQLPQGDPPLGRDAVLTRAAEICAQRSARLGDWSLRYAPDGLTPDILRFGCR